MKSVLKNIIVENQHFVFPKIFRRNLQVPFNLDIIISIIGVRRSGKTFLLYEIIQSLISSGINVEKILYINFEDERLSLDTSSLDLIIQAYIELYPELELNEIYIFFDEIQNITGWEKFVRRIFDTKTRHIFITGSNSKLLGMEIATELRGRTMTFTVYPLCLGEYLNFQNIDRKLVPEKNKGLIINQTEKFLVSGGFPEILSFTEENKRKMLQQYFNVMIFKDIVERYKISNIEILKFFIKKIFAGVTKPFSINKAYNDIKSLGYKISNKYLYEYFNYCNDVFLCLTVNKFDFSEIKQEKSDKKAYITDNGLLSSIEFSVSQNKGKLLENMVALELIKSGNSIFYFKNQYECDFIVENMGKYEAIQVAFDLSSTETKQRELRGLVEACKTIHTDSGLIITFDTKEEFIQNNILVKVIPVYEYFLNLSEE